MSEFYTKVQSDAQAAKIGAAIKNVRTAIPTVGTAASKNIGAASDEIPLVQDVAATLTGKAIDVTSVKSGAASYKRGWRKVTGGFYGAATTSRRPHGASSVATVSAKAEVLGKTYLPNDTRSLYQYTLTVDGNDVIATRLVSATGLDNAVITFYIDEEL